MKARGRRRKNRELFNEQLPGIMAHIKKVEARTRPQPEPQLDLRELARILVSSKISD
jgi:hypothetical protein